MVGRLLSIHTHPSRLASGIASLFHSLGYTNIDEDTIRIRLKTLHGKDALNIRDFVALYKSGEVCIPHPMLKSNSKPIRLPSIAHQFPAPLPHPPLALYTGVGCRRYPFSHQPAVASPAM